MPESGGKMRFPKRIRYRGRVRATIYGKSKAYPLCRVAWTPSEGKRRLKAFPSYSEALQHAENMARDVGKGQAHSLTVAQAADAQVALAVLDRYYQDTGKRISLPEAERILQ
jgi:hypothetical protein